MLRYHKFTTGSGWTNEFGHPDEESGFNNVIRYSPLHNVPDADKIDSYPAIVCTTGKFWF